MHDSECRRSLPNERHHCRPASRCTLLRELDAGRWRLRPHAAHGHLDGCQWSAQRPPVRLSARGCRPEPLQRDRHGARHRPCAPADQEHGDLHRNRTRRHESRWGDVVHLRAGSAQLRSVPPNRTRARVRVHCQNLARPNSPSGHRHGQQLRRHLPRRLGASCRRTGLPSRRGSCVLPDDRYLPSSRRLPVNGDRSAAVP